VALLTAIAGCSLGSGLFPLFRKPAPGNPGDGLGPISPNPDGTPVKLVLYFGDTQALLLLREDRTVMQRGESVEELAIWELIKGPSEEGRVRTVPKETRLLSVQVVEGIAYANFSREIQTKHWGGSTGEMFTVQSIVNTLAENNKAVNKVQFLLEGKIEEAIWGHGMTSEPIGPNLNMISK
jgi:spore germination protein GerM